jgi:hypothetical protein
LKGVQQSKVVEPKMNMCQCGRLTTEEIMRGLRMKG